MSIFAPQAYTKETLAKAFEWIQHQPASVKQAAGSPDMLVSIYTQAMRQGIQKIDADAPVSSRKFVDDLKTLSKDFAQFDDSPSVAAKYSLQQTAPVAQKQTVAAPILTAPPQQSAPPPQPAQHPSTPPQEQQQRPARPAQPTSSEGFFSIDEKSLSYVRKVQERFNLSTPQEALRMVIAVGIENISRWN
jgi:hypothetical protein